jgi:flagellar protein FlbB
MARYQTIGSGIKIIVLLLLLILLVVGAFIWFDYLGLYDGKDVLAPVLKLFGIRQRTVIKDVENPLLLEKERINKQFDAMKLLEEDLAIREAAIEQKEKEVTQMASDIEEQGKALTERENSFNQRLEEYDKRRRNIEQSSQYLTGMPPEKAKDILLAMDDVDIIDIFRVTEERAQAEGEVSIVAYWLSLMPKERAAEITRKMSRKTGN